MAGGTYPRTPKGLSKAEIRLRLVEVASKRLMSVGMATNADAIISLAEKLEKYVTE